MIERLKGDDTILKSIKKLGKEDLYADMLFFLRFGSLRYWLWKSSLFMDELIPL